MLRIAAYRWAAFLLSTLKFTIHNMNTESVNVPAEVLGMVGVSESTFSTCGTTSGAELIINDDLLRERYPANVEGSKEFNEVQAEVIAEEQQATTEDLMQVLQDPKVKEMAFANAQDIKKRCKGWFTLEQLSRKLMLKPEPLQDLLNLLCLFEYAYREQKGNYPLRYKIQFSKEDKLAILQERLKDAEKLVKQLRLQMQNISNSN